MTGSSRATGVCEHAIWSTYTHTSLSASTSAQICHRSNNMFRLSLQRDDGVGAAVGEQPLSPPPTIAEPTTAADDVAEVSNAPLSINKYQSPLDHISTHRFVESTRQSLTRSIRHSITHPMPNGIAIVTIVSQFLSTLTRCVFFPSNSSPSPSKHIFHTRAHTLRRRH